VGVVGRAFLHVGTLELILHFLRSSLEKLWVLSWRFGKVFTSVRECQVSSSLARMENETLIELMGEGLASTQERLMVSFLQARVPGLWPRP
jgi:hypothetical protein